MNASATVITSTIGRRELRQCIESVRAQTYPVRHMVYVNGARFHESARSVIKDFPDVHAIYLEEETGDYGEGPCMADVFAASAFLTRSDWVLWLDDDNFFDPNHVASLMELATANDLEWAYSLRRLVRITGEPICDDDWCSLGHWPIVKTDTHLVDNSCYLVKRRLAQKMALAWTALPMISDRCFFMALRESGSRYGCTGLSTVNYRIGTGTAENSPEKYLAIAEQIKAQMPGGFPWRTPHVFDGHLAHPATTRALT